jgi:hypothetical protein
MNLPAPETVTSTTPLRLETAAQLAFPDGSIGAPALRRLIANGQLEAEKICGKYFVTLGDIERMRQRCRENRKVLASPLMPEAIGSSEMDKQSVALDAMNATAQALKQGLQNISSKSTTQPKRSAKVIRIQPK